MEGERSGGIEEWRDREEWRERDGGRRMEEGEVEG